MLLRFFVNRNHIREWHGHVSYFDIYKNWRCYWPYMYLWNNGTSGIVMRLCCTFTCYHSVEVSASIVCIGLQDIWPNELLKWLNSSPPGAAYMRQWTWSALIQIMASRLDGAKPLSEPMLTYCQLDPKEYISMEFYLKTKYHYSRNAFKHVDWPFCLGGWVLIHVIQI